MESGFFENSKVGVICDPYYSIVFYCNFFFDFSFVFGICIGLFCLHWRSKFFSESGDKGGDFDPFRGYFFYPNLNCWGYIILD